MLMEQNEFYRKLNTKSSPVEILGHEFCSEPEQVQIDFEAHIYKFKVGFKQPGPFWKNILSSRSYAIFKKDSRIEYQDFSVPVVMEKMLLLQTPEQKISFKELQVLIKKVKADMDSDVPAALNRMDLLWHDLDKLVRK